MLFNSLAFLLFLPIVFALYWSLRSLRWQNTLIIAASFFFYGWWDWRFLLLMIATCVANYIIGNKIVGSQESGIVSNKSKRRPGYKWLLTAILINIGILGVFKYFNFFADNLAALFSFLHINADIPTLRLILPIGISFYTFQLTAYVVDIYRGQLKPAHNLRHFLSFVCFFPQLVAGPIERGANLLPQFSKKRKFIYDDAVDGMRLFLWGLMKKMLVADNCAPVADYAFANYQGLGSADLVVGLLAFTVQVYCDFSGYSDMAIGTARLFGIRLSTNFNHPFFATTIR
ncbi:MAG: MBOAT family protein, partial [Bacteroidaceae bacterium]|nr:MBOAT family protein [Bacteroidaceae bacterium]